MDYSNNLKVDTSEMNGAIREAKNNLKILAQEISRTRLNTVDYNTAMDSLKSNFNEQQKKVNALKDKYELLRSSLGENAQQTKNVQAELEKEKNKLIDAKNAIYNYKNGLDGASSGCKNMCHALTQLEMAIYDVAKGITTKACKALVDFTKETINTGMQFESAFAGVRKVTSGTEEEFKELETQIRQTALEKPISADQLASVYQMGSQLGIAKDGLKDFSNAIIDLAKTSDLTEEAGATMIAQYANVTGLKEDEYRKFASTLSMLGSTTATTESTIMDFASRISGSAKLIGMSHQEILALSTALGSVGIKAEMGGSAISKIMNNIDVAVDKNNDTLKTWAETANMSASDFARLWKTDVASAFQAVISGMATFKDEGGSLNLLLEELDIKNIRQTETLKKLANASELLTEDMSKANEEWVKATFLGESAGQVYDTLEAKTQLLQNSFNELRLSIYDDLKEPLKEATEELANFLKSDDAKKFAQEFSNIIKGIVKVATGFIKTLITNFDKVIVVAKALTNVIATMITSKVITSIFSFISAIKNAGSIMAWFNTIVAANPLGLLATVIAAVIVGLVNFAVKCANATNAMKEQTKALEEQNKQLNENKDIREKAIQGIESETGYTKRLVEQLKELVDENGKVIDGKEYEVNKIIPLLKEATGMEIELIDGQIIKYKELIDTIDDVIEQKRLEAMMDAYKDDYSKALKEQKEAKKQDIKITSELIKKETELENEIKRRQETHALTSKYGTSLIGLRKEVDELQKQKDLLNENEKERQAIINEYENMAREHYTKYEQPKNEKKNAQNANTIAGTAYANSYNAAVDNENKKKSSSKKEDTHTSYQELLNQEKTYQTQLQNYLTAIKQGNSEITVEMVEDTKKKLDEVQKKVKDMKQLLGDNTVSTKLVLDDETYGGLNEKREELAKQLKDMQSELTKGNQDITQDMLNNVGKQIDQIDAKIKNLKNEWDESGNDGEISDEFESENTNHKSTGVIFGKGVLGENAVEMAGAGKDAAAAYLEGYKAEKERQKEQMAQDAIAQANQEALNYQIATIDPANIEIYDATEKYLAESKQTSQAQGLEDNAYKVVNAETWTLNQAIAAARQIDFTVVGKYICDGIALGIEQNKHVVIEAVRAMMEEANDAAESEEEIESPSKVFYRYGRFMDMGLANGIKDYAKLVSTQVQEMTSRANEAIGLANSHINAERYGNVQAFKGAGNTNINYNFTQNNTSNKSLDTLAIYQETKSMLKRTVRNQYV